METFLLKTVEEGIYVCRVGVLIRARYYYTSEEMGPVMGELVYQFWDRQLYAIRFYHIDTWLF